MFPHVNIKTKTSTITDLLTCLHNISNNIPTSRCVTVFSHQWLVIVVVLDSFISLLPKVTTRWQATEGSIWGLRICGSWEMTRCQDSTWMGWTTCASAWREDEPTGASNSAKHRETRCKTCFWMKWSMHRLLHRLPDVLYTALQAAAHAAVLITHSFPFMTFCVTYLCISSHPFYSHWLRPVQCVHKQLTACMLCVCLQPLHTSWSFHIYIIECKGMCWPHPRMWTSKSSAPSFQFIHL